MQWTMETENGNKEEQYNLVAACQGYLTKEQLVAIDLSQYDQIVTYPGGVDWPLERKKILFLQTAVRLGCPWCDVVQWTHPYFGHVLRPPFDPVVEPTDMQSFTPPPFDVARQTPGQWATAADEAWNEYRTGILCQISEWRRTQINQGALKELPRPRRSSGIQGLDKAAIAEEKTAFEWAVCAFLGAPWSIIARYYPPLSGWHKDPNAAAKQRRKRAGQIRKRVQAILGDLRLPLRK